MAFVRNDGTDEFRVCSGNIAHSIFFYVFVVMVSAIATNHTMAILPALIFNCPAADSCCEFFADVLVGVDPVPDAEALATVFNPGESAAPNPVTDANGIVLVPITMSEVPRDMAVPKRVMAVLPWNTSVPEMARPLGYAVSVWLAMMNVEGDAGIMD